MITVRVWQSLPGVDDPSPVTATAVHLYGIYRA